MSLQRLLRKNLGKPLKIDVRDHCEYNLHGCISRTFEIPRRDLVALLSADEGNMDIVDRVDISEFPDEDRCAVYNPSRMDQRGLAAVRARATGVTHWDPEPQYGEGSAGSINKADESNHTWS